MSLVNLISVSIFETNDMFVRIRVTGDFPTSGWGVPHLSPRKYVIEPNDGIMDFDLIAAEPEGSVEQVITRFSFDESFPKISWEKGVRVHAKNTMEALIITDS